MMGVRFQSKIVGKMLIDSPTYSKKQGWFQNLFLRTIQTSGKNFVT